MSAPLAKTCITTGCSLTFCFRLLDDNEQDALDEEEGVDDDEMSVEYDEEDVEYDGEDVKYDGEGVKYDGDGDLDEEDPIWMEVETGAGVVEAVVLGANEPARI